MPLSSTFAEYGASLFEAASPEERAQALDVLDLLFPGDPAGRRAFTDRILPGVDTRTRHALADVPADAVSPVLSASTHSGFSPSDLQEKIAGLIPLINADPTEN